MAVRGELPEEYCQRILAITGDTPLDVAPKWQYKVPRSQGVAHSAMGDRSDWTLDDYRTALEQLEASESVN
jgi:hypothetical protein